MDKSILEVVHESANDLHDAGLVSPCTMREFDVLCLPPIEELSPLQIKRLRTRNSVSQAVFAAYLNTSVATVRKWEAQGDASKRPNGAAMKLLNMVKQHGIDILGQSSADNSV